MLNSFIAWYKKISVHLFGNIVDKNLETFKTLKNYLLASDMKILLRTWVCMIFMTAAIVYAASLAGVLVAHVAFQFDIENLIYYVMFMPVLSASFAFLLFYVYPIQKSKNIDKSIENNLPFALAHMNSIASSGIPPEFMFELLINYKEYGAIAIQSKNIVRNIKAFGMSSVDSLNEIAKRTPNVSFKQILMGMSSTIEKGGDLKSYLEEMSDKALFEYRLKREKFLKTLSTYADIYTAFMITAPLLLLSALVMMGLVGGQVFGMGVNDILFLITWIIIPIMNVVFLMFIHITYPGT